MPPSVTVNPGPEPGPRTPHPSAHARSGGCSPSRGGRCGAEGPVVVTGLNLMMATQSQAERRSRWGG
eukprot:1712600-Rhodomonas_salina.2